MPYITPNLTELGLSKLLPTLGNASIRPTRTWPTIGDLNGDIVRGGVLSTGDRMRDIELLKRNDRRLNEIYRKRYGERVALEGAVGIVPVMLPIEAIPHEDRDRLRSYSSRGIDCSAGRSPRLMNGPLHWVHVRTNLPHSMPNQC